MFDIFATAYVQVFTTFLPALALGMLGLGAVRAGVPTVRTAWTLGVLALLLGLWHAAIVALAKAGILMPPATLADPPYALMPLIGGSLLLWSLGRFTATGQNILAGIDQRLLIGFQIPRVMGGVFLIGWLSGYIPWQFAFPAGLGDIWAGVAAMRAVRALQRGQADADRLVRRANIIGLGDFALAVVTGLITTPGFVFLLARDTPNIINAYPLALFPAFFVPMFIAFHLFSLAALRRPSRQAAPV